MCGSHSWCSEIAGAVGSVEMLNEVSVWSEPLRCHRRMDGAGRWGLRRSADGTLLTITGLFRREQMEAWTKVELGKEKK